MRSYPPRIVYSERTNGVQCISDSVMDFRHPAKPRPKDKSSTIVNYTSRSSLQLTCLAPIIPPMFGNRRQALLNQARFVCGTYAYGRRQTRPRAYSLCSGAFHSRRNAVGVKPTFCLVGFSSNLLEDATHRPVVFALARGAGDLVALTEVGPHPITFVFVPANKHAVLACTTSSCARCTNTDLIS